MSVVTGKQASEPTPSATGGGEILCPASPVVAVPGDAADAARAAVSRGRGLAFYRATVPLIRGVAWPIVLALTLFYLRAPLWSAFSQVSAKLGEAEKFSAGGLAFEMRRMALAEGYPELSQLAGLSPRAVLQLFTLPGKGVCTTVVTVYYGKNAFLVPDGHIGLLQELERKGLARLQPPLDSYKATLKRLPVVLDDRYDLPHVYRCTRPLTQQEEEVARNLMVCGTEETELTAGLLARAISRQLAHETRLPRPDPAALPVSSPPRK